MYCDGIRQFQVLQLREGIFHGPRVIKNDRHHLCVRIDLFDPAEVAVENAGPPVNGHAEVAAHFPFDLVIVAGLHDLVSLPEDRLPAHMLPPASVRGIEHALQDFIEPLNTQAAAPHGSQHLNLLRPASDILWKHLADQLHRVFVDHRNLVPLQKKEIPALVVHRQRLSLQNSVGIHDNVAPAGLPEDMAQHDGMKSPGIDQILQDASGPHTGQLVDIPDKDQPGPDGYCPEQIVKKIHIHHRHLIYNDDICLKRVIRSPLKIGIILSVAGFSAVSSAARGVSCSQIPVEAGGCCA